LTAAAKGTAPETLERRTAKISEASFWEHPESDQHWVFRIPKWVGFRDRFWEERRVKTNLLLSSRGFLLKKKKKKKEVGFLLLLLLKKRKFGWVIELRIYNHKMK